MHPPEVVGWRQSSHLCYNDLRNRSPSFGKGTRRHYMNPTASILIVDDEEDIRRLLATALRRAGYQVSMAEGGAQALDLLRTAPHELVVTDLLMPGMNGLDLLRHIAERFPSTKGIVLTGYGSIQSAVEATKLGADNYITKPVVLDEFLRIVRATLERGQSLHTASSPTLQVSALAALTRLLAQPDLDIERLALGSVDVVASMLGGRAILAITDADTGQEIIRSEKTSPADLPPAAPTEPSHQISAIICSARAGDSALLPGSGHNYNGVISISRPHPLPAFSTEESQLLQMAANQVSIALGNLLTDRTLALTLRELREVSLQTVQALVRAVEMRDRYTAGHSARVSRYAVALARSVGLDPVQTENLRVAALLHDVGKVGISDLLLNKPGPLTREERAYIQQHPAMGCQIVEGVQSLAAAVPLIMHHQERYDGAGYPNRLAGEQIPFAARILAVADSFEAITATRAYRQSRSVAEALEILRAGAGQQWDAFLIERWRQIVGHVLNQPEP